MRVPQDISQTLNAYLAFRAALISIKGFNANDGRGIESVLCPGLGTLTGAIEFKTAGLSKRVIIWSKNAL
jgi:hypothetical protein